MRSLLILAPDAAVPEVSSPRADVLILGGPAPEAGRLAALRALASRLYVRPEPGLADLPALLGLGPDGVVLAPAEGGIAVARLGSQLAVHEAEAGLADGALRILAVVGTARGILLAGSLTEASARLDGLGWDADALARDLGVPSDVPVGVSTERPWAAPLAQARASLLIAAAAAGVPAIETAGADPVQACRDGFAGLFVRAARAS